MRLLCGLMVCVFALATSGCTQSPWPADDGETRIVCSFFPMYLFTKNIVGDTPGVTVEMMVPAALGCPHDYDLSPEDIKRISRADLYVMNGAGLESFGADEVREANDSIIIIDSSLGVAMLSHDDHHDHGHDHDHSHDHDHAHDDHEHDHDHEHAHDDHDHDHDHDGHDHDHDHAHHDHEGHDHDHDHHDHDHGHAHHGHSHAGGKNPHFFSSPRSAAEQVKAITKALVQADPDNADAYRKNGKAYADKLEALADKFAKASESFQRSEIVTMHEVFDYLARDAGLSVVTTIFPVAGQDPSPAEVRETIEKIREAKAVAVFTEPQYPSNLGEMIAEEASIPVDVLDPVASGPVDPPIDYYEMTMEANLQTLTQRLAGEG